MASLVALPGAREARAQGAASGTSEAVRALRVWPGSEYTRVTLESANALKYSVSLVKDPDRLVLDLEDVDFNSIPSDLANRFREDPYVKGMRAGRFKPGVVRLVFDLKAEVKPQVFALKPVAEYGHRLVLDIYPTTPPDPLLVLLQKQEGRPVEAPAASVAEAKPDDKVAPAPSASSVAAGASPAPNAPPAGTTAAAQPEPAAPKIAAKGAPSKREANPFQRTITIVVDAGHGGEDPGARGPSGSMEKHVTLAIAKRLKALIDAEPNMRAVLTRDSDFFIPLTGRVEKARRVRADLFVSIHADAFMLPHARGSSVFALSERGATSVAARWLAKRENEADLIGGVNIGVKDRFLAQTLLDLSQTATISDSLKLGRAVLSELGGINRLHKNYVEQAGFAVLKAPDIPSILVETAFISNPDEEKRLHDEAYQDKMARAVLNGVKRYFAKNPPTARHTFAALDACLGDATCAPRR